MYGKYAVCMVSPACTGNQRTADPIQMETPGHGGFVKQALASVSQSV